MTYRQKQIMKAMATAGEMTLAQITELVGYGLYSNASKHVGVSVSKMVKNGMLERVRPGVFRLKQKVQPALFAESAARSSWWSATTSPFTTATRSVR